MLSQPADESLDPPAQDLCAASCWAHPEEPGQQSGWIPGMPTGPEAGAEAYFCQQQALCRLFDIFLFVSPPLWRYSSLFHLMLLASPTARHFKIIAWKDIYGDALYSSRVTDGMRGKHTAPQIQRANIITGFLAHSWGRKKKASWWTLPLSGICVGEGGETQDRITTVGLWNNI